MSVEFNNMNENNKKPEDLQTSETHYRRIFESSRDGIMILDALTQKIIDANPSVVELSELSRNELLGKKLKEIGLFKNDNESLNMLRDLREKNFIRFEDVKLQTKSGKQRNVEFTANIYRENELQFIYCNIRDITELKAAREQTKQKAILLAQIAGKAARLGGWTIKLPERTLVWSDENCAIHEVPAGYTPTLEEGIGYYPEEYRAEVARYVETCATEGISYDFELPKYTAKGNLIWVRSIGEAVRDAEGRIIGLQGAFQDITARKQVEAEKEKLIKELQDALAEVKTLQQFLPVCSYCRKVRDDQNYWSQIESYISRHTGTQFSHGICPECYETNVTPQIEELKRKIPANSEIHGESAS